MRNDDWTPIRSEKDLPLEGADVLITNQEGAVQYAYLRCFDYNFETYERCDKPYFVWGFASEEEKDLPFDWAVAWQPMPQAYDAAKKQATGEQEANYVTGADVRSPGDKTDAEKYQPYVRFYQRAMWLIRDIKGLMWKREVAMSDSDRIALVELKAEVAAHEAAMGEERDDNG